MSIEANGDLSIPVSVPVATLDTLLRIAEAIDKLGTKSVEAADKTEKSSTGFIRGFNAVHEFANNLTQRIGALVEGVTTLASEQAALDANSARLGLSFDAAASAAGRFTDETEAMAAATRLAEAGINLTQEQLNSLTIVAARFAQNTGTTTAAAIEALTNGLITGSQRGLRPFGDELARTAGTSHTAAERLAALTAQAGHTERATDDAAHAMARFRDTIEDAERTFATGFADGASRMMALGESTQDAADAAEDLQRNIHAAGAAAGEMATRALTGVAVILGTVATTVGTILAGIASIGGGLYHLARGGPGGRIGGLANAMSEAAQIVPVDALARFTASQLTALENQSDATDRTATSARPDAAPVRPGVRVQPGGGGGGGADPEAARIMARSQLMHDAATQERSDLDRTIEVRRRDLDLQRLRATTLEDEMRTRVQSNDLTQRAAVTEARTDRAQIEHVREIIELLRERERHTTGARRTAIQHDINTLLAEEVTLTRRIEDAVHSVARANAERWAAERSAMSAAQARANAASDRDRGEEDQAVTGLIDGLRAREGTQRDREKSRDPNAAAANRAVAREERLQQRRLDSMQSFTERWRDLHEQQVDSTQVAAEMLSNTFSSMGDAMREHVEAAAEGRETAGEAVRGILADTLDALGKEAMVKGTLYAAEGLAALARYDFGGAATAFAASAAFIGAGALIGYAGTQVAPASPAAAPSAASGSSAGSSRVAGSSRPSNDNAAPATVNHFYAPVIGGRTASDAEVGGRMNRFTDATARRQLRARA